MQLRYPDQATNASVEHPSSTRLRGRDRQAKAWRNVPRAEVRMRMRLAAQREGGCRKRRRGQER